METAQDDDGRAFAARLHFLGERLTSRLENALDRPSLSADVAREVLQEMATGLEELRVAEEELTVQSEQIALSYQVIDAERERYGQLFEFAPDAYLETDSMGKIVEANSGAERLLGVNQRFLIGKLLHSFVAEHDRRAVRQLFAEARSGVEPETMEFEVVPRDLAGIPVEARMSAAFDPALEGGGLRVRWLLRDISDRLKRERELHELQTEVELLDALGAMNRLLAGTDDVDRMLRAFVDLAVSASGGADVGVMLADTGDRVVARAVSGTKADDLCETQLSLGGPAMETLRDGAARFLAAKDLGPWPALAEAAARHGIDWVVTVPVTTGDGPHGVFNLYGRGDMGSPGRIAVLLAEHAADILRNSQLYSAATTLARQLETAMESRGVIEQAKGVLMAQQGCDADRAFDILRRASQRQNVKLRTIAEQVVARTEQQEPKRPLRPAGTPPPPPPPPRGSAP